MNKVLLFVEDPGAANGLMDLPETMQKYGWSASLVAAGAACQYLQRRKISFNKIDTKDDVIELLDSLEPQAIITGTAVNRKSLGLFFIEAAKKKQIMSIGYVDAIANPQYRFSGETTDPLAYCPNHILVAEHPSYDDFIKFGIAENQLTVVENPYYERTRQAKAVLSTYESNSARQRLFGAGKDNIVITFLAEISEGNDLSMLRYSEEYQFKGRGRSNKRTHIVLEEVLDAVKELPYQCWFVLRLHPKNDANEFDEYLSEINQLDINSDPLELVYFSDVIIGMNTSLLAEASLMGKVVFSVLPREIERKALPDILNKEFVITNKDKLRKTLKQVVGEEQKRTSYFQSLLPKKKNMAHFICTELLNVFAKKGSLINE